MQHAVDAVLDGHFLVPRFDVDIARPALQRIEDGGVDQLDDGRDIAVGRRQPVDGQSLVLVLFVANHVQREAFGHLFEHALGLFGLLQ